MKDYKYRLLYAAEPRLSEILKNQEKILKFQKGKGPLKIFSLLLLKSILLNKLLTKPQTHVKNCNMIVKLSWVKLRPSPKNVKQKGTSFQVFLVKY